MATPVGNEGPLPEKQAAAQAVGKLEGRAVRHITDPDALGKIRALASSIPELQSEEFVREVSLLFTSKKELATAAGIIKTYAALPGDERAELMGHAMQLFTDSDSAAERLEIAQRLNDVPSDARSRATPLVGELATTDLDPEARVEIVKALAKLPPARLEAIVTHGKELFLPTDSLADKFQLLDKLLKYTDEQLAENTGAAKRLLQAGDTVMNRIMLLRNLSKMPAAEKTAADDIQPFLAPEERVTSRTELLHSVGVIPADKRANVLTAARRVIVPGENTVMRNIIIGMLASAENDQERLWSFTRFTADAFSEHYTSLPHVTYEFKLNEPILPQLERAFGNGIRERLWVKFEGESGIDVGGLTKTVATNASHELLERFGPVLEEKRNHTFSVRAMREIPSAAEMHEARYLGSVLALMLATATPPPRNLIFSQEFFDDLCSFPPQMLQAESIAELCEGKSMDELFELHARLCPQEHAMLASMGNVREMFDATYMDDQEMVIEMMRTTKELKFQVAKGLTMNGAVHARPAIQEALTPPSNPKEIRWAFTQMSGDAALLESHLKRWVVESDEADVRRLLFAATGNETLAVHGALNVICLPEPNPAQSVLPQAATCFSMLKHPPIPEATEPPITYRVLSDTDGEKRIDFRNYDQWKAWFTASLPLIKDYGAG
ncbi:MAG: hypothetical protein H7A36_01780 [Chlamydiales bacterium]|nr:hypothetical protein [Chlamydiales bacterium]